MLIIKQSKERNIEEERRRYGCSCLYFLFFPFLFLAIFCPVFFASAESIFRLSAGPYSIDNLGPVFRSAEKVGNDAFYQLANGDVHYNVSFNGRNHINQIVDVNITKNTYRVVSTTKGGFWRHVLHGNQKLYVATNYANWFYEYDPENGNVRIIGQLANSGGAQSLVVGNDGAIYIGECCYGVFQRYDPVTDILEPAVDPDPRGGDYQYAYTIGSDGNYVYVALGQNPWYLAVYDRQRQITSLYFKNDNDNGGEIVKRSDGNWYYRRSNTWGTKWYKFEDGTPVEISYSQLPPPLFCAQDQNNAINQSCLGYQTDTTEAYPNEANGGIARIKWKKNGENEKWNEINAEGVLLYPVSVKRMLYLEKEDEFFITTEGYNPALKYNPVGNLVTYLGEPGISVYNLLLDGKDIYLSGYPAVTERYDTSSPWTLRGNLIWDTNNPNKTNPYVIPPRIGKYHYYSVRGDDGLVYIGSHHERDSTGGDLLWYNPSDGSSGNLREPFVNYDVGDLTTALSGSKIIYSSTSNKIFVFDTASKTIEKEIVIPGGFSEPHNVEIEPGIIFGVTASSGSNFLMYRADIRTGEIISFCTVAGTSFGSVRDRDRRLILGPDKRIWLFVNNSLYRINPMDYSMEKVINTDSSNLMFHGNDLYFYGGTDLRVVKDILEESSASDLNLDFVVDQLDFDILKSDFLKLTASLANPRSDIDGDGQATIKDVGIMMSEWRD